MRPRLSYANVMATLAVFIALGGASYAALKLPKNSIGTRQLKRKAVTTAKIRDEAVTAAKVKKGTLTGIQINAATLGQVPTARTADSAQTAHTADSAQTADGLTAPEPWHVVGAPGEPQFEHGWRSSVAEVVAFYKDQTGVVHLKGRALLGESDVPIFQLPPGFRPAKETFQEFATGCDNCGSAPVQLIYVDGEEPSSEGSGSVLLGIPAGPVVTLDGITFRAES